MLIFEGCVADPVHTITAMFLGWKWNCLLLRIVLQDALREVMKVYLLLKLKVSVDDIKPHSCLVKESRSLASSAEGGMQDASSKMQMKKQN